jgi:hypothetical protein
MSEHPRHRPLRPEELDARAAELSRRGPRPHPRLVTRVVGQERPNPQVHVVRDGDGWKVEVDLPGAVAEQRPGLTVGAVQRPATTARAGRQVDSSVPDGAAISVHPETAPIEGRAVTISGRAGRVYHPLLVSPATAVIC